MNDSFNRFKFRVWNKKTKKMKKVMALISEEGVYYSLIVRDNKAVITPCQEPYMVLMQCTGLKDKNGKLIYEGDIVSGINGSINGSGMDFKTIIKWDNDNCCFNTPKFGSNKNPTHWYEVIGNIYENPELLEDNNE